MVVERRGRAVAAIGPAVDSSGRAVKALLRDHRPDSAWAVELRALRRDLGTQDRDWNA